MRIFGWQAAASNWWRHSNSTRRWSLSLENPLNASLFSASLHDRYFIFALDSFCVKRRNGSGRRWAASGAADAAARLPPSPRGRQQRARQQTQTSRSKTQTGRFFWCLKFIVRCVCQSICKKTPISAIHNDPFFCTLYHEQHYWNSIKSLI